MGSEFGAARKMHWLFMKNPASSHPIICFDKGPKQLINEMRKSIPPEPGISARYDTKYECKWKAEL
jgi:hypothetical protein